MHCIYGTKESSNSTEEAAHEGAARDFRNDAGIVGGDSCGDRYVVNPLLGHSLFIQTMGLYSYRLLYIQ